MANGEHDDERTEHDAERDAERVQSRADALTADELEAGSDDPLVQAEAILAESDARIDDRDSPSGQPVESGHSDDNVDTED